MKNLLNKIIKNFEYAQLFNAIEFGKEFNNVSEEKYIEIT